MTVMATWWVEAEGEQVHAFAHRDCAPGGAKAPRVQVQTTACGRSLALDMLKGGHKRPSCPDCLRLVKNNEMPVNARLNLEGEHR